MRSDKSAPANTRQKVVTIVTIVVVIVLIWQIYGMFSNKSSAPAKPSANAMAMNGKGGNNQNPQPQTLQPVQLTRQDTVTSQREAQLMQLQQETEAKYFAALNELQMLKISQQIAEANQAIVAAKLATVTAQKNIVDLLAPPAPVATPSTYAQGLANPTPSGNNPKPAENITAPATTEANYSVISVSRLENKWMAVLGYQGSLYNVGVGDILPADQSKVVQIDRNGVTIEKNGTKLKISMIPII